MFNIIVRFLDEEGYPVYELTVDKEPSAQNIAQERKGLIAAGPPALGEITQALLFHSNEKEPRTSVTFV